MLAEVTVVLVHRIAAFLARRAIPAIDFDISTAPAVGVQYLGDQREEVVEPAVSQGAGNRRTAIAFAEAFVLNVRVRDALIAGSRPRIEGYHTIGLLAATDLCPVQTDFKASEIDLLQDDRVGRDRKFLLFGIDFQVVEFPGEGPQIPKNVRRAGTPVRRSMCFNFAKHFADFILQALERIDQIAVEDPVCQAPAALACQQGLPP